MFETLFGADVPLAVRFFIAFLVVLGLIGGTAWAVRRFGGDRLGSSALRGRQPRLAVIDATAVDSRRRLVLIRRDNVEHLLMIGGPTDVVVEPNIVRAVSARDAPAGRGEPTLPRAVPLPEGSGWPLQPEPAPVPPAAPTPRPATRAPLIEEPAAWTVPESEPAPAPTPASARPPRAPVGDAREMRPAEPRNMELRPAEARPESRALEPRRAEPRPAEPRHIEARHIDPRIAEPRIPEQRGADTLAGLAEELSARHPPAREATRESSRDTFREPVRPAPAAPEPVRMPTPQPVATAPVVTAEAHAPESNDQNLADMAQRLEAALRRPMAEALAIAEPAPVSEPAAKPMPAPRAAEPVRASAPVATAAATPAVLPAPPEPEPKPMPRAEVKPAQPANFYDSLEQEMASLLGRPQNKG